MKNIAHKVTRMLSTRTFFYVVLGFFIFEALWFVFSAIYPMPFDEDFHLGVIRIYAEQWSPFLAHQPASADQFGALVHDPSYFYHYLMSFPYRFIQLFTHSETIQVICLRLINVAMCVWGILLYRKVLLRAQTSPALIHVTMAIFVLIPIVPQLAAHINYDNALMILVPLLCLTTFNVIDGLKQRHIDMKALLLFISVCFFSTIIKYPALPFVLAAVLFLLYIAYKNFRGHTREFFPAFVAGYKKFAGVSKALLIGLALIGGALFTQRYVVNVVLYKTPVPDCGQVLTVKQCSAYGPWGRDHGYAQQKNPDFKPSPASFMGTWMRGMWHRLFFAINGAKSYYNNYRELPVPSQTAVVLAIVGGLVLVIWWRPIFRGNTYLAFFATLSFMYIAVLWLNGYSDYSRLGRAVAINGRYLLPVLPLLAVLIGRGMSLALSQFHTDVLKPYLAVSVILLFLYGGGIFTFILRSDDSWYWPNQTVRDINNDARHVVSPFIYKGTKN